MVKTRALPKGLQAVLLFCYVQGNGFLCMKQYFSVCKPLFSCVQGRQGKRFCQLLGLPVPNAMIGCIICRGWCDQLPRLFL